MDARPSFDTSPVACVFDKALLAQQAACGCAQRRAVGERLMVECSLPVARLNCATLSALFHERARFALRLPPPGRPLMHAQALRLQCGGLQALAHHLAGPGAPGEPGARADVHRLVGQAQSRHGSLLDLPWPALVASLVQWRPRQRRGPSR